MRLVRGFTCKIISVDDAFFNGNGLEEKSKTLSELLARFESVGALARAIASYGSGYSSDEVCHDSELVQGLATMR